MKYLAVVLLLIVGLHADEATVERQKIAESFDPSLDPETRQTMADMVESNFGLKTFRENYIVMGMADDAYPAYTEDEKDYKKTELEFQLSVRYDLTADLLGLGEIYTAAYTQRSFWQVAAPSGPFRETVFNPEFMILFPYDRDNALGYKGIAYTPFSHMSNGQRDYYHVDSNGQVEYEHRSRAWNHTSATLFFEHGNLFSEFEVWYRYDDTEDENPDLLDYLGHGQIKLMLPYKKHLFTTMGRYNFATGYGAVEGSYSYPVAKNVFLYGKVFAGYGESLIDYNRHVNKYSIGFSFSR